MVQVLGIFLSSDAFVLDYLRVRNTSSGLPQCSLKEVLGDERLATPNNHPLRIQQDDISHYTIQAEAGPGTDLSSGYRV